MNNELQRTWKRPWINFKYFSGMSGGIEENHEKPQSEYPVSATIFKPRTS
jgi:hypothetical protein